MRIKIIVVLIVSFLLFSCADRNDVKKLEKEVADLQATVYQLQWDMTSGKFGSVAYITPGSEDYAIIKSDLGYMVLSLDDVQPYANGCRITLCIGNLTSAQVDGAKAMLEWGSVDDKGMPLNESARLRAISFSQTLHPGAWTNVSVVLEGVPPTDLRFVRLKQFHHTSISLDE
jgi:hypothetical protein